MGNFGSAPVYKPISTDLIDARIRQCIENIEKKSTYGENKLKEENAYLQKVNANLEREVQKLMDNISPENGMSLTHLSNSELRIRSEKNIDKYISDILKNPETNISWLPDAVEKNLYKNIAVMLLNILETTVENSEIKLLGHRIKFVMDPVTPTKLPKPPVTPTKLPKPPADLKT
jgi:hypothetical protein